MNRKFSWKKTQIKKNYSKTSWILWQYCRDEPAESYDGVIVNFVANNAISLIKIKKKKTDETDDDRTKNVEIMVPLKW